MTESAETLLISADSVAIAAGADRIAARFTEAGQRVIRTGSLGMTWAEPCVQVERGGTRTLYANVSPEHADVTQALNIGSLDDCLEGQQRLIFGGCGRRDPLDLDAYRAAGGFAEVDVAVDGLLAEIEASGLRGRGGAGFPAHIKWRTVAATEADRKYVVCNADEGDSGTFADRMIMEGDPYLLIEGMMIAGRATGASKSIVYLRSEYPVAARVFAQALQRAGNAGLIGPGAPHDVELVFGAGAYICGEETALLESLEGRRGEIRVKPPLPAIAGLFGRPTLVHNVLTLCSVPWIVRHGGAAYAQFGIGRSTGTMPFQISGNVLRGGLVEVPFGMPLGEMLERWGGGTRSGRPIKAVQIGGPLGAYLAPEHFNTPLTYEAMAELGAGIGHGGIVVFDDSVDMAEQARFAFEFCRLESCGKCTPCRIGSVRGVETMSRIINARATGETAATDFALLQDLCEVMRDASLCQMGGMTPVPVLSALENFPADFKEGAP
ncbi:MAG: NADH-ubiquinone oxidoreductase-F iron-sulfur binding region domain-containing protein [Pseudomonadales bacterium]